MLIGTMKSIWRLARGVKVEVLDDNRFLFTFFSKGDVAKVLEGSPWMFDKHVLLLKKISGKDIP